MLKTRVSHEVNCKVPEVILKCYFKNSSGRMLKMAIVSTLGGTVGISPDHRGVLKQATGFR